MRLLQFFNHFSIDVALGAMISSLFFAKLFGVTLNIPTIALLGLAVWLIYTFDHLEDARSIKTRAITLRHRLHQDYFKLLSACLVLGLFGAAVLVFFLPKTTLVWGSSLFCLVAVYFLCLHFLPTNIRHYKEAIIAVLYTAGVLLPVLSIYEGHITIDKLLIISEFALLAFTNLLIFSLVETDIDRRQQFPSIVISIGHSKASFLLKTLAIIHILMLTAIFFFGALGSITLVLAVMMLFLYLAIFFSRQSTANLFYRILGDAVFILPVLVL